MLRSDKPLAVVHQDDACQSTPLMPSPLKSPTVKAAVIISRPPIIFGTPTSVIARRVRNDLPRVTEPRSAAGIGTSGRVRSNNDRRVSPAAVTSSGMSPPRSTVRRHVLSPWKGKRTKFKCASGASSPAGQCCATESSCGQNVADGATLDRFNVALTGRPPERPSGLRTFMRTRGRTSAPDWYSAASDDNGCVPALEPPVKSGVLNAHRRRISAFA